MTLLSSNRSWKGARNINTSEPLFPFAFSNNPSACFIPFGGKGVQIVLTAFTCCLSIFQTIGEASGCSTWYTTDQTCWIPWVFPILYFIPCSFTCQSFSHLAVWRQAVMLPYRLNVHHIAQFHDQVPQHIPSAGIQPMVPAMPDRP